MANLTELFLFGVLLPSFSFASGLIVYLIGHRKQNVTEENKGKRTPSERLVQGAVEPNLPKHLKYRGEVRTDLRESIKNYMVLLTERTFSSIHGT